MLRVVIRLMVLIAGTRPAFILGASPESEGRLWKPPACLRDGNGSLRSGAGGPHVPPWTGWFVMLPYLVSGRGGWVEFVHAQPVY